MRIYLDGIFDVLHRGHVEAFKQIKNLYMNDDVFLIVGVISDDIAMSYKRRPSFQI